MEPPLSPPPPDAPADPQQPLLEGSEPDDGVPIARLTDRFLAYCIDAFLFLLPALLLREAALGPDADAGRRLVWHWGWVGGYLLYQTVLNASGRAPLGKKLLGLQVVTPEGEGLGLARSFLRAGGYLLSGVLFELGFLWALTNPLRRTWHDLLGGSVVVESGERPGWVRGLSSVLSVALGALLLASSAGTYLAGLGVRPGGAVQAAAQARAGLDFIAELEDAAFAEQGVYTDDIRALAARAGGLGAFRDRLREHFQPEGFGVKVTDKGRGYVVVATGLDGREVMREGGSAASAAH